MGHWWTNCPDGTINRLDPRLKHPFVPVGLCKHARRCEQQPTRGTPAAIEAESANAEGSGDTMPCVHPASVAHAVTVA